MELDFSVLNQIPAIVASNDFTEPLDSPDITMLIEEEEPEHSHRGEPESGAIHRLDREKEERERARQAYATYQQNIKRAGELRSDILKGLRDREDPQAILLKAVECISLITGDTGLYTQSEKYLLEYGNKRP